MVCVSAFRRRCVGWLVVLLPCVAPACAHREITKKLRTDPPPAFSASGDAIVPSRWWVSFNEPQLNAQINQALEGSFTLAAAVQRLAAARAVARREASDLLPDVNGVGEIASLFGPGRDRTSYTWGLDTSYQVDVWGQIESRVQAQRLRASASREDYHAIALTLSAEITRTWFSLIEANAQVELLNEQTDTNQTGLELQEARFGQGLIRSADVLRQRQLLESTLEQSAVVKARVEVLEHQLAVLLGQMPQSAAYNTGSKLPELPPLPETGLPCDLLNRRPDVRRDYLAFVAADRDLASAITAQYPRISLTGSVLNVAERPETLFRDWFVSLGGQLVSPLFDGGQRRSEVDRTTAVARQRFNEYGQTMLTAFREVEDALALERRQLERLTHLQEQSKWANLAAEQLREQYLIGDADYLDVLSAITAYQRLQRETLSARLELHLIRVALYLALAGDFEPRPDEMVPFPESTLTVGVPAGAEIRTEDLQRSTDLQRRAEQPSNPDAPRGDSPDVDAVPKRGRAADGQALSGTESAPEMGQLIRSTQRLLETDVDE